MMAAPLRLSYMVMLSAETSRSRELEMVTELARQFDVKIPEPGANHYSQAFGEFRLRWERHTEFTRYQFMVEGIDDDPFVSPAIDAVPRDWVAALPGQLLFAAHAALISAEATTIELADEAQKYFGGSSLVGARIAGGSGTALTDFRIHDDNFSRLVVYDHAMSPRQAGRMVQRLLEIDTYRVLALLALPLARELMPFFARCRADLSQITADLADAHSTDEPAQLERLTHLEAELWNRDSDTYERFSAADAYYALVRRRTEELREVRMQGLQTFKEFTERRLAPAMETCRAVVNRQSMLYMRVGRATQLLATRVDLSLERQNQALLASMDRRANLQLRLQETVEGLSVAAITYYVVGLISYAAEGAGAFGADIEPALVTGISIPIVVILVAMGVRRIRRRMLAKA
jgi:uncharacterized membrane-anchored protein